MKFTVTTAGYFYDVSKARSKYESAGFTFKESKDYDDRVVIDNREVEVELNTLDDLMAFSDKFGQLVVSNDPPNITIYDDYME
jgi:hypothetical protein